MTAGAKEQWRRQLLGRRRELSLAARSAAAVAVCRWVVESVPWSAAATVLAYAASGSELSTEPLLSAALAAGKGVVLPRVVEGGGLRLHAITSLEQLKPGYRGILEPGADLPEVPIAAIDLALVPGVGFDGRGNRLGYGGGYYDRLLGQPGWQCPVWGLAFACQLVDELPRDAHDHPVVAVVTETGILRCRR